MQIPVSPHDRLRHRIRILWWLDQALWSIWAFAWSVLWGIFITCGLMGIDLTLHYRDGGLRWVISLIWVCAWIWALRIWLRRLDKHRSPTMTSMAERLELDFPHLGTRFSSAVAFTERSASSSHSGSATLRAALVRQVVDESASLLLHRCLPWRAATSAIVAGSLMVILPLSLAAIAGPSSVQAIQRLAQPWSALPWPQDDQLVVLRAPEVLVRGGTFIAYIGDNHRSLPKSVRFHMRYQPSGTNELGAEEVFIMNQEKDRAVVQLTNIRESFYFRATGGDDERMEWNFVKVVDPPVWTDATLTLIPPAYTRQPSSQSTAAFHAIEGTTVSILGQTTRPVKKVTLVTSTGGMKGPIELKPTGDDDDNRHWQLTRGQWVLKQSGHYQIQLVDDSGLVWLSDPAAVDVAQDRPPQIMTQSPRPNIQALVQSQLSVTARVTDDVGLERVEWRIDRNKEPILRKRLYLASKVSLDQASEAANDRSFSFVTDLAMFELETGNTLTATIEAIDTKGQTTSSSPIYIELVSRDRFDDSIRQLQSMIVQQLQSATQEAEFATNQIQIRKSQSDDSERRDRQWVKKTILHHTGIASHLWQSSDSCREKSKQLLQHLHDHRLNEPQLETLLIDFLEALQTMAQRPWMQLSRDLGKAESNATQVTRQALEDMFRQEESILTWVRQWEVRWGLKEEASRIRTELSEIYNQQQRLHAMTQKTKLESLASANTNVTERLQQQAMTQDSIKRQWDQWRIQVRNETMYGQAPSTRTNALEYRISELRIGPAMQRAARLLRQAQAGRAWEAEAEIIQLLDQATDLIKDPSAAELPRDSHLALLEHRRVAELPRTISAWRKEQAAINRDTAAAITPDKLTLGADVGEQLAKRQTALRGIIFRHIKDLPIHESTRTLFTDILLAMSKSATGLRLAKPITEVRHHQRDASSLLLLVENALDKSDATGVPSNSNQSDLSNHHTLFPSASILAVLQERLAERTRHLDQRRRKEGLTPPIAEQIQEIADQQLQLARWIEQAISDKPRTSDSVIRKKN